MNCPPEWLASFAHRAAALFSAVDVLSPLACHFCEIDDLWEVTLFASQTEILGGSQDGRVRPSRFHVDVKGLFDLFDDVEAVYWQAHGLGRDDELGPHLGMEGYHHGYRVWLRVPALAPKRFPPGRVALLHERMWEELW